MDACIILVSLLFLILYFLYLLTKRKFNYWKTKNVPYIKPLPFVGNYGKFILLQEFIGETVKKLCQQFPNSPYFGAFFGTEPVLVIRAPEVLKQVMTKDFYYFNGREISNYAMKEIITKNMFFNSDDKWKTSRQMVAPLFSPAKMKKMFTLIEKCCYMFEDMLNREIRVNDVIEAKDLSLRYTMDGIMSCAFGIESNTMLQPENNLYHNMAIEIFKPSILKEYKLIFRSIWPLIFYGLGLQCFPSTVGVFYSELLKSVFENRNYKPSVRNDFIDHLLNLKQKDVIITDSIRNSKTGLDDKIHVKLDDDILVAQCLTFFGAGFETSATTLAFVLYELAKYPDVQKRAADEVDELLRRRDNKLDYECIEELPYLEACVLEALRKYPVLANLTREVMEDYTFPDGLHLDKGVRIHIPVYYMHHNPEYFPEPEKFLPERFLPENKEDIKQYTFFPYGEGPRNCIGKRFSKMQTLPGLVTFLKKYRLELAPEMPHKLNLQTRTLVTQARGQGLMLKIFERDGWEQRKLKRC